MVADKIIQLASSQYYSAIKLQEVATPARSIFFTIQNMSTNSKEQDALLWQTLFLSGGAVWDIANNAGERANLFIIPREIG